jgi:hypothetical protein
MKNLLSQSVLVTMLASAACSTSSSDDIWMPPGGTGKADGFTTIKGSDIPSKYVDPTKYYMIQRKIANLSAVGALDMTGTGLAARIDGIIANMPADGEMNLAELVRMEDPAIFNSLFPAEQAELPNLWKLVQAPDANDVLVGNRDNFGVVDSSTQPAAAVPPASLAIASLSTELQAPATRLENLYNSDGDVNTVTLADLTQGIANPAAFTPAEETAFPNIQAVFRTDAVAVSSTTLDVSPGPGSFTKTGTIGPITFHLAGTTKFDEERDVYTSLTTTLTATQTLSATADTPSGAQVFALNQDTGAEAVFPAGTVPSLAAGVYVFEVWQAGLRTYSSNAELPLMTAQNQINLNDKLDYTLVSGLTPLVRNLSAATANTGGGYSVHYTYDTTTIAPPTGWNQFAVARTTSPTVMIPVGRYSFPGSQAILYVYPNNVLWVSKFNQLYRLLPSGNQNAAPQTFYNSNIGTFTASSSNLYCSSCSPSFNVVLKASDRDI